MSEILIETVEDVRSPLFRASYGLYRRVFPRDEQMPERYFYEHLVESRLGLSRPFNFNYLIAGRGDRVLGFGCCTYLAVVNMGFIDYLAVDAAATGEGVGTAIRDELVERLRADSRAAEHQELVAVLGEVQTKSRWLRRLQDRREAVALDIDYLQPPLDDSKNPMPLVLYVQPIAGTFESFEVSEVRSLLYALYHRLYRIPYPLQDPSFRFMIKQLSGRERVGAKKIAPP